MRTTFPPRPISPSRIRSGAGYGRHPSAHDRPEPKTGASTACLPLYLRRVPHQPIELTISDNPPDAGTDIRPTELQEDAWHHIANAGFRDNEFQDKGLDTIGANLELGYEVDRRRFELPGQILKQLGIESVRLITNNPEKVAALELAGIRVVERISADVANGPTNIHRSRLLTTQAR